MKEVHLKPGDAHDDISKGAVAEGSDPVPTGRFRLERWQFSWLVVAVQVYVGMASASLCSAMQARIVKWRNKGKYWFEQNYDFVLDGAVVQFTVDNRRAKVLHVSNCTNLTIKSLTNISGCADLQMLIMNACNMEGMSKPDFQ